jgi:hypothetical protein
VIYLTMREQHQCRLESAATGLYHISAASVCYVKRSETTAWLLPCRSNNNIICASEARTHNVTNAYAFVLLAHFFLFFFNLKKTFFMRKYIRRVNCNLSS